MAGNCAYPAWQGRGACRGFFANCFFPPSTYERRDEKQRREVRAKAICSNCQVEDECLDYALAIHEVYGIWGGTNGIERRRIIDLTP
ncbi:MAG: WhiB family transcriptional regulator [Acidimicrobiales bacterium]|jgi:WhiB family redox-sensing transcriptional regulator|nr:WhiB family transcriptional regulator [Acidimicrobiales bacterium]MEE1564120.1 WhiB family transcriptional regulator [Acidimicrobiales bacterium]